MLKQAINKTRAVPSLTENDLESLGTAITYQLLSVLQTFSQNWALERPRLQLL